MSCRACLVARRSLVSVFQRARRRTYAELLADTTGVKIQLDDGYSDVICKTCRRKLEEAYDFKTLVEESDKTLRGIADPETKKRKFVFDNVADIKVEIDGLKPDNVSENEVGDVKDFKLDFNQGNDEVLYNNIVIKKLLNTETKEINVDEFLTNISMKQEPGDSSGDDHFFDDFIENDEYFPSGHKEPEKPLKKGKRGRKKKTMKDDDYFPSKVRDIKKNREIKKKTAMKTEKAKLKEKIKGLVNVNIKPVILEDVRIVPSKPTFLKRKKTKKEEEGGKKEIPICPYCGSTTKNMKSHMLTHTGERNFKCKLCQKAYFNQRALEHHEIIHSGKKNFKCDTCGASFYFKESLFSHKDSHNGYTLPCKFCSKKFKQQKTLVQHELRHSSAKKSVKCELCNMTFFDNCQLKHHMRIHTGERPWKCERHFQSPTAETIIRSSHSSMKRVITHMKSHNDIKHSCKICSKKFLSRPSLLHHEFRHNSANKSHKCELCNMSFFEKSQLKHHTRIHTGERPYNCKKNNLLRHELRHSSANKSIKCESCKMTFFESSQLKHHMRIHTGERPYNCEICSQPYSYKHDFNRHCYKKHGIFLKRRTIYTMNPEVLVRERVWMEEAMLAMQSSEPIPRERQIPKEAWGMSSAQAAVAYQQTVESLQLKSFIN